MTYFLDNQFMYFNRISRPHITKLSILLFIQEIVIETYNLFYNSGFVMKHARKYGFIVIR